MPTKLNPDGSPNINRDPGDKDWEQKTAHYDSRQREPAGDDSDPRSEYDPQKTPKDDNTDPRGDDLLSREQVATETDTESDIGTREAVGDGGGWKTTVSGEAKGKPKGIFTKKRSLWGLIALVTASAGFVITGIVTPAITIINLKEVMVNKFSKVENSVIDKRSNRILAKKISKDITTGCSIKIKCRYKGMSSREIGKFNRRNESEGWRIEKKGRSLVPPFKNKVELQRISGTGDNIKVEKIVDASEVKQTLREDPSLQKSFRNFNKGIVSFWADTKARSLWQKFGVKLQRRAPEEGDGKNDKVKKTSRINKEVSDVETDGKGHAPTSSPGVSDVEEYVDGRADELATEANDSTKATPPEPDITNPGEMEKIYGSTASKLANASPSFAVDLINPVASVIYPYCTVKELTKATLNVRKTLITIQLIRYAINFARLADQIKAGDAGANTTQEIGDMTSVLTEKNGFGQTAFDSFGYNWAAYGKLGKRSPTEDITKYQTGGGPPGLLSKIVTSVTGLVPQKACNAANNPVIIGILLVSQVSSIIATFGGSAPEVAAGREAAEQGIKTGLEYVAKKGTEKEVENLTKNKLRSALLKEFGRLALRVGATELFFHYAVPPMIGLIARAITGTTITGGDRGPDVGNAAVSGFGAAGSASGRAHGLALLNKTDAVASDQVADAHEQQLAKINGASQFDIHNPNSFATKLASATLPYLSQLSFANAPTALAGFSLSSLGSLGNNSTLQAADDNAQYEICKDEAYDKLDAALDPFCNPQYGMPVDTIESDSTDPDKVINYMLSHHYIDGSGGAKGDYQEFLDKCPDSTDQPVDGDSASSYEICKDPDDMSGADKTKYTMFHYYTIDGGVNDDMETDDASPDDSADPVDTAGATIDMDHLYDSSVSVGCATGTNNAGTADGYSEGKKVKIRLCEIPNFPVTNSSTEKNGHVVINSRASGAVLAMIKAAKEAGVNLSADNTFRTMSEQQVLWEKYGHDRNQVAPPGYSNHQMGLAIDFNGIGSGAALGSGPRWDWLEKNASNFSYKNYPTEAWHWSPTGN